jgi:hypothetical protein
MKEMVERKYIYYISEFIINVEEYCKKSMQG